MKKKSSYTQDYKCMRAALLEARKKAGLKQVTVGKEFGAHASFVSKCESGKRRVDVVELAEFCRIYKVPLSEFLEKAGLR